MHADAEHHQDHADFGELTGERGVADESRRERPYGNACQQIAENGREAQPDRGEPADEGES